MALDAVTRDVGSRLSARTAFLTQRHLLANFRAASPSRCDLSQLFPDAFNLAEGYERMFEYLAPGIALRRDDRGNTRARRQSFELRPYGAEQARAVKYEQTSKRFAVRSLESDGQEQNFSK